MKVIHLTSVHPRFDTRIFLKQCSSLATEDFDVSLVVADGKGNQSKSGINIFDVGRETGRFARILKSTKAVYNKAIDLNGDVYHLHDPELIPTGLKLLKKGKKVIFDAHEDFPKQLRSKPYLNTFNRKFLSYIFDLYERYTLKKFNLLVGATPQITEKLLSINPNSININNYPIIDELKLDYVWDNKKDEACYLGGITAIRGITDVIKSLRFAPNVRLNLAGKFSESSVKEEVVSLPEWQQVNELGFINRIQAAQILNQSKVGIVTFHPHPNHIDAQPNKMFEYMSAGLPVVASNFPLWKEVIEENNCGICVDPLKPREIGEAIEYIISNPKEAEEMGRNGQRAVLNKYNWNTEEARLIDFYKNKLC